LAARHLDCGGGPPLWKRPSFSAITDDTSEAKITGRGRADRPGVAAELFRGLADAGINVDMIVQNTSANGSDTEYLVHGRKDRARRGDGACRNVQEVLGAETVSSDDASERVADRGRGMKSSPGVKALMFKTVSLHGINIEMISTSSIVSRA